MDRTRKTSKGPSIGMHELSMIELRGTAGLAAYSKAGRDVCRDMAAELDWAAHEVQAALTRMDKHPLLKGIKARYHARRVASRLRRARDLQVGAGIELVKFWYEYRARFAPAIAPPKARVKQSNWDFER